MLIFMEVVNLLCLMACTIHGMFMNLSPHQLVKQVLNEEELKSHPDAGKRM